MQRLFKFYDGETIDIERFSRQLIDWGYVRQTQVQEEGDFARHGGVCDVFPVTFEYPLRIEWEHDKIISINSFSLSTGKPFWKHQIVIVLPKSRRHSPQRTQRPSQEISLSPFLDIRKGDYVVHQDHGIGRFLGIQKTGRAGAEKDHMVIQYAGQDRLFVPLESMHLVQKYVAFGSRPPKIYPLGSGEWRRIKQRVRKATVKVALDLLKLQAVRKALGGYAYPKDTDWQKDFEKGFPYAETTDQARAVEETKKDMESAFPMDRLLCGDVGYGKTEVAMRAAFKAVMGRKQVAFLVPTTILAEQHYQNFKKRVEPFAAQVEMLSRFKTQGQQKAIIRGVADGSVDIVIGTHRLLSQDIRFKDLGLVIIDEEQRFGVKAKERLKQMRTLVDVLTLTATPIPRTLYMSLVGVKDISMINTPPENRLAVETYVVEYEEELLRQAIVREIQRRGQVFFVHNRVEDIQEVKQRVEKLCPVGTRVEFAHGQMPSGLLEKIMVDFLNNAIDVLVSTTIIESGIDVPNANTMIINNADMFGLADLHQLRGRVGRFDRKAYAYFVVHPRRLVTSEGRRRLEAIQAYSELGSGFKIAMEDLEIRGGGNLLGVEQHGFISAVGFDLYCRLLKEASAVLKHHAMN